MSLLDAASRDELRDFEAWEFWADPQDREMLLRQLENEGVVEDREVGIESLEGESRWIEATLRITDENGKQYLDGIAHDVTEKRERRRRLERAETMFNDAQDALFLIDVGSEFTVERVNQSYEEVTGLSDDEIPGRRHGKFSGRTGL